MFDEYGVGKMSFFMEKNGSLEVFLSFLLIGIKVGEKVLICCYIMGYFEKEYLFIKECVRWEFFY